jgi:uncharacterized protein involved in exopolysaccharide biosynthesis
MSRSHQIIQRVRELLPMLDPPVEMQPTESTPTRGSVGDQLSQHLGHRFPPMEPLSVANAMLGVAEAGAHPKIHSSFWGARSRDASWLGHFAGVRLYRAGVLSIRLARIVRGGRVADVGRLPRYVCLAVLGLAALWIPIVVYLKMAPVRYTSKVALILPGAGVSTSVNLSDIGQASTSANSPYSSPSLSPTVLYKNLLESYIVIERAARSMDMAPSEFGKPTVKLVDETSLIHYEITGKTPEDASKRAEALRQALLAELDKLRADEINYREIASTESVRSYEEAVDAVRTKISALQLQSGLNSAEQYSEIVTATEALQTRVAETQASLSEKDASLRSLSSTLDISTPLAMANLKALADPELTALSAATAKNASEIAELEKQFGPGHPKVRDARLRALGTRTSMIARGTKITGLTPSDFGAQIDLSPSGERVALLSRLVGLSVERDGLVAQFRSQSEQSRNNQRRVHDLVEVASKLDTLTRDYKVADAVFASALTRINTSKTDVFASYPMLQVAEPASLPEGPSSPSKPIAVAAGAGGSMFLMIALALAWVRRPLITKILARRELADAAR